MRRIIFLDIDGVLNSVLYNIGRREGDGSIDKSRLVLLKELIDKTGAEIVLSTTWRRHWSPRADERDAIGDWLNELFEKYGIAIADKTPLIDVADRASEVRAWLAEHEGEVETFVIIDDMAFGWGELCDNLVLTDPRIDRGLGEYHICQAADILLGLKK